MKIFLEVLNRLGNAIVAFAGIIIASTGPIDWHSPQFWAGVALALVPALRNTTDKLPRKKL